MFQNYGFGSYKSFVKYISMKCLIKNFLILLCTINLKIIIIQSFSITSHQILSYYLITSYANILFT